MLYLFAYPKNNMNIERGDIMRVDGTDHLIMDKIQQQTGRTKINTMEDTSADNEVKKRQESIRGKALSGENTLDQAEELEEAVEQANDASDAVDLNLRFQIHEKSERIMVEVVDIRNNEVVKEIPSEQVLNLVGQIQDLIGFFLDEQR